MDPVAPGNQTVTCGYGKQFDERKAFASPPSQKICCRVGVAAPAAGNAQPCQPLLHCHACTLTSSAVMQCTQHDNWPCCRQPSCSVLSLLTVMGGCEELLCLTLPVMSTMHLQPMPTCGDTDPFTPGAQTYYCDPQKALCELLHPQLYMRVAAVAPCHQHNSICMVS
jgi:hypothetical protein